VYGVRLQKARQARIQMTKTASRKTFLANKRRFEARLQMMQDGDEAIDADSCTGEDVFQLQHHHLLACLERTTV